MTNSIHEKEEQFHDQWAENEIIDDIDVIKSNEALTAPEMRFITRKILSHGGKTLLDVGSGLGEASIYFAIKGLDVTALDISSEMLLFSEKLANKYKVQIKTVHSTAESFNIKPEVQFDFI